jgi:hypothetical protein
MRRSSNIVCNKDAKDDLNILLAETWKKLSHSASPTVSVQNVLPQSNVSEAQPTDAK